MSFNKEQAEYALDKTETVDGLRFSGNNHKIGQLLSLHGHLKDSMKRITLLESKLYDFYFMDASKGGATIEDARSYARSRVEAL